MLGERDGPEKGILGKNPPQHIQLNFVLNLTSIKMITYWVDFEMLAKFEKLNRRHEACIIVRKSQKHIFHCKFIVVVIVYRCTIYRRLGLNAGWFLIFQFFLKMWVLMWLIASSSISLWRSLWVHAKRCSISMDRQMPLRN